jgi:hypothetical protein
MGSSPASVYGTETMTSTTNGRHHHHTHIATTITSMRLTTTNTAAATAEPEPAGAAGEAAGGARDATTTRLVPQVHFFLFSSLQLVTDTFKKN